MKKKNILQRTIIIAIVTLIGLYVVIGPHRRPRLGDFSWAGIKNSLKENIRLGLDLKGGSHLVMRVKTEEFLKNLAMNNALAAQTAAKEAGFTVKELPVQASGGNYVFSLEAADPAKVNEIRDEVNKRFSTEEWAPSINGNIISWSLTAPAQTILAEQATEGAMKIIESRINEVGVAEPTLQRHGAANSHQILLQMPGIQDPKRVKDLLIAESKLQLVRVVNPSDPFPAQTSLPSSISAPTFNTPDEARAALGANASNQRLQIVPYAERDEPTAAATAGQDPNAPKPKKYVVIEMPPVIEGSELRDAQAVPSRPGGDEYEIHFQLKPTGANKFGAWTSANINANMGVVLNNEVKSIAFIRSRIDDSGMIEGRFTKQSAEDLSLTLRSGALPAPIEYQEERTVGPSLGADSIRAGVLASIVGLILVILFMVFYYRGSGLNAVLALLLNLILTLAAMVLFKATLTLPGIAGLILSIGMTVDTNVLIFERIREELETGKTIWSAVEQGFARAFVTVIDTHVTTIVSALFLFVFGTGPIRGFAVTLVMGLLANLFSAVYVSRTIFMWVLSRRGQRAESLSI
ncbi:MAG TPA: protein translocase subunit SecD [Pyrinomonadaceae bacterium]|jgi:preprotein translocase subunit SecD